MNTTNMFEGRRRPYGPARAAGDDADIAAWCIVDG
jgi:hypothetical protein